MSIYCKQVELSRSHWDVMDIGEGRTKDWMIFNCSFFTAHHRVTHTHVKLNPLALLAPWDKGLEPKPWPDPTTLTLTTQILTTWPHRPRMTTAIREKEKELRGVARQRQPRWSPRAQICKEGGSNSLPAPMYIFVLLKQLKGFFFTPFLQILVVVDSWLI